MARKKITLTLTPVEAEHLMKSIADSQDEHHKTMKRLNSALTSISAKLRRAMESGTTPEGASDGD